MVGKPHTTPAETPAALPAPGVPREGDAVALRDVTRLYLKALEAQRAKDGLLAVAAHELRHPLHLMRLALVRHLDDDQPAREALERYIQRMSRLIDDLIDFIRTEQDTLELRREWLDVHQFLLDLMDDYRALCDQRRVRLLVMAPVGVRLNADVQRLLQVFANLLDNALKFTPAGGAVVVEATANTREVRFTVRDNGRGLSPEMSSRALELPIGPANSHGLGIGLAVSRRIVELHGGALVMKSDGLGRGTEAVVTLPLLT